VSELKASTWQRAGIEGIARRLAGKNSPRAALLQLPTGFGKSFVAVRVYGRLRRHKPGLRLMVVLPKQAIPVGWKRALGLNDDEQVGFFEPIEIKSTGGTVVFQTLRRLKPAMLNPGPGSPPAPAHEIASTPHLVVVDEVHRHQQLLKILAKVFIDTQLHGHEVAERLISAPFRSPKHGRRAWPKWLLLSATPVNPVSLDRIDPLDQRNIEGTYDPEDEGCRDEEILTTALETTHGALAQLAGEERGPWFDEYVDCVREGLLEGAGNKPVDVPRRLVIWPPNVRIPDLRLHRDQKARWNSKPTMPSTIQLNRAIFQLVQVAAAIENVSTIGGRRRATAERLVLSGGQLETSTKLIQGEPYSVSLSRSVKAAVARHRKLGISLSEKQQALLQFVASAGKEHVLIFCVHRAVARAVSELLAHALGTDAVKVAIGDLEEQTRDWFNEITQGETRVLVATDACSESIDLHERANVLVHYELPWSPLRVLQRVGRLWRLRQNEIKEGFGPKRPRLPGVVHLVHPGSVDEEIASRLRRRWGYLRTLGLDYLSYNQAMGIRLPAVPQGWVEIEPTPP